MDYKVLKARHRAERTTHHPNLALRVHRALSWLNRAEQLADDPDGRFIFLWIAFNAAYATEIDERFRLSEQETFRAFLRKLVDLDDRGRIAELVWTEFSGSIRLLLDIVSCRDSRDGHWLFASLHHGEREAGHPALVV
jgi:hypothetical protein